jgi:hypothetical protein
MGKTYVQVLTKPHGEIYQRREARAKVRYAHHRQRRLNQGCHDEMFFVPFSKKFKRVECLDDHNSI